MSRWQVHRSDNTEAALVEFLEKHGCTVEKIHQPMDLLVERFGIVAVVDAKSRGRKMTTRQVAFTKRWTGIWALIESEVDCRWLLSVMTPQKVTTGIDWGTDDSWTAERTIQIGQGKALPKYRHSI